MGCSNVREVRNKPEPYLTGAIGGGKIKSLVDEFLPSHVLYIIKVKPSMADLLALYYISYSLTSDLYPSL